jgi:flavodoxin
MNLKEAKILVAYFSRTGSTYMSGKIVNTPVGYTEVVAKMIQEMTGCDLFKIEVVNPYPKNYYLTAIVTRKEQKNNARPELTAHVENMDAYDVVILGYPIWWGTFPMAVSTFLEEYDFSRKTILPFCTHGGSLPFRTHEGNKMGRTESDIKKLCSNVNVLSGLPIKGSDVQGAEKAVSQWLQKSGIL